MYTLQLPNVKGLLAWNRRSIWSLSNCRSNQFHNHLVRKRTLSHLASLETHKIHLPFSCKSWTSTSWQTRIIGKTLTLPKKKILNSMTQIRENGTPWFWTELAFKWYESAMVFCFYDILYFYFLFRTTLKKNSWIRAICVTVMVIILKLKFWKLLDVSYVQRSFPSNYEVHWQ